MGFEPFGNRAQRAGEATRKSLVKPPKRHTFGRVVGWTLLSSVAAAAGYLLWRRSQPIEDPWAEEYWTGLDADVEVPTTPAESAEVEEVPAAEMEDPAVEAHQDAEENQE